MTKNRMQMIIVDELLDLFISGNATITDLEFMAMFDPQFALKGACSLTLEVLSLWPEDKDIKNAETEDRRI